MEEEYLIEQGWVLDQVVKGERYYIFGNMITGDYNLITRNFKKFEIFNLIGTKNDISFDGYLETKEDLETIMRFLKISKV